MITALLLALSGSGAQPPAKPEARPQQIQDVTDEPPGTPVSRNGVRWREWTVRDSREAPCGKPIASCRENKVMVYNSSARVLRCRAQFRYAQPNKRNIPDAERSYLVLQGEMVPVVRSWAPADIEMYSYFVDCQPEPAPPALDRPEQCMIRLDKAVEPSNYFPAASRAAQHEGPVILEFTARESPAAPVQVRVVGPGLYPELDEVAVRMAADMQVSTNCPGERFRMAANFTLD